MLLRQQGLMWLCNVSLAVSVAFSVRMPKAEGFKWVYPEERKLKNDCVLHRQINRWIVLLRIVRGYTVSAELSS